MELNSGVQIDISDSAKMIQINDFNSHIFCSSEINAVEIRVLFRYKSTTNHFGVLRGGDHSWSVHMSTEEAVQLKQLLPDVVFLDERMTSFDSAADTDGEA